MDQTTYNGEILPILLNYLIMHEIDDMDKECDFGFKQVEEHIYQFKNHQFRSSYLLLKSQNFEIFHT